MKAAKLIPASQNLRLREARIYWRIHISRAGATTYPSVHERTSQNPETHSTPRAWGMVLQSKLDFVGTPHGVDSTQPLLFNSKKKKKEYKGRKREEAKKGKTNKRKGRNTHAMSSAAHPPQLSRSDNKSTHSYASASGAPRTGHADSGAGQLSSLYHVGPPLASSLPTTFCSSRERTSAERRRR